MSVETLPERTIEKGRLLVNRIVCGHALEVLQTFPDRRVDMVFTSPPYWGLRDYRTRPQVWDGNPRCPHEWIQELDHWHSDRGTNHRKEVFDDRFQSRGTASAFCPLCGAWRGSLGLEPSLDLYIHHLGAIFDEIRRVLKPSGTCWVNLGDTYASNQVAARKQDPVERRRNDRDRTSDGPVPRPKSLCLIPARFSLEMLSRGWILRNRLIWHKPNAMPSSAKDRFTVDFEEVFFFVRERSYYFETQYEPYRTALNRWGGPTTKPDAKTKGAASAVKDRPGRPRRPNPEGRQKRSVWSIPTEPFPEAHFAVYPPPLLEAPILAGCPERVCAKCGIPHRRAYEGKISSAFNLRVRDVQQDRIKHTDRKASPQEVEEYHEDRYAGTGRRFAGWRAGCACDEGTEPGIVLDPFMGAGTTALAALDLGRRFVGIELNQEYVEMANRRIRDCPGLRLE